MITSSRSTTTNVHSAAASILRTVEPIAGQRMPTFARPYAIWGRIFRIDSVDRKILAELQRDGRLTITELAAKVKLSVSPCHRRLRDLERSGVIRGYRAVVNPAALGFSFEAVVFASMRDGDAATVA